MWSSITPQKFDTFDDLKSLLRYLQLCVHSVIIDFVRHKEFKINIDTEEEVKRQPDSGSSTLEDHVINKLTAQELYKWLLEQLQDEREKCVVYCMFVMNMKPSEVAEQYPDIFADVREVYRVKENLLARLRRNDELNQFFDDA
jgi:DNA-directed RNA polymerase specialized sigma24 family protein